jgi:uncharacterized protein YjbI with pentapeptide repeats
MPAKLTDLQLIYGAAGAREYFEHLAAQLVKGECPRADKVRTHQGDDGVDVYVGELTDPTGIRVFQCKFFPQKLGKTQKDQIRDSFDRCRRSTEFKVREWVLCVPIDLSLDEKKWFEDWRARQGHTGIAIDDPWGATKLESLLYQDKNKGLREQFFREGGDGREKALQDYLTWMGSLMQRGVLRDSPPRGDARTDATAMTSTTLSRLDGQRKGILVAFLAKSALINSNGRIINLKGADLSGADLQNTDLRPPWPGPMAGAATARFGISLRGANLQNANLRGTRLSYADLREATLVSADLRESRLCCARLRNADLSDAKLDGANLGEADLQSADLRGATLRCVNLGSTNLTGVRFADADLRGANFRASNLMQVQVESAKGDMMVQLPSGLARPVSWTKGT